MVTNNQGGDTKLQKLYSIPDHYFWIVHFYQDAQKNLIKI